MSKPLATFFVSHGSPRMLVDPCPTTEFYAKIGEYARKEGIQGIVWMASHWETPLDTIEVACNPKPDKDFVAFVPPETLQWYRDYQINASPKLSENVCNKLKDAGFNASLNPTAIWHQDVMIPMRWMYPDYRECPPMAVMSVNGRFDPWFHLKVGLTLRSLRAEKILLIGSGGGIHNLYTVSWHRIMFYHDTATRTKPIDPELAAFAASMRESVNRNSGPQLGNALGRLLQHPHFLKSNPFVVPFMNRMQGADVLHRTPEHFLPMVYAAGACSTWDDSKYVNAFGGENWEMDTQLNANFVFGLDENDTIFLRSSERDEKSSEGSYAEAPAVPRLVAAAA
ncbi:LigB subunit of an aromatic-ring-opening dioxygenase LigAB [Neolentinus lepideus HHB14362 ss-1]|uniref:LigB subunit of an aromatic-ring-opening dioxygenase LigAB n=1 Tax=Neolentinus lepideus HHB14362 ss-1 TaxID=1314782 RepID=A0A165NXG1_9AGAM|nr:LigB subunit of an aromatic-ring-opening dioxygenase LigAB [Neolentinus lepideus HHB14362 ss-1]